MDLYCQRKCRQFVVEWDRTEPTSTLNLCFSFILIFFLWILFHFDVNNVRVLSPIEVADV